MKIEVEEGHIVIYGWPFNKEKFLCLYCDVWVPIVWFWRIKGYRW